MPCWNREFWSTAFPCLQYQLSYQNRYQVTLVLTISGNLRCILTQNSWASVILARAVSAAFPSQPPPLRASDWHWNTPKPVDTSAKPRAADVACNETCSTLPTGARSLILHSWRNTRISNNSYNLIRDQGKQVTKWAFWHILVILHTYQDLCFDSFLTDLKKTRFAL